MPTKFVLLWISLFPCVRFQPKAIASESLFCDILYVFAEMFLSVNNAQKLLYKTVQFHSNVDSANLKYQWTIDERTMKESNLS